MNDDMMDTLAELERETRMVRARNARLERAVQKALEDLEFYGRLDSRLQLIKRNLTHALEGS